MEDQIIIELLQQIQDGKTKFSPEHGDIKEFQKIANALVYMGEKRYVELLPHRTN